MLFPLAILFLAPWLFAAGAAAVAIPVLIHFLNRRRYKTVQWAAMDFLLRAMKKNRRRLRFESLLLLLTRCAVLLLLGTALARPFGCNHSTLASFAGSKSALHVIVIDNGYAMGYAFDRPNAKTHLEQARLIAKGIINRLNPGSEAVVILTTAGEQATSALPTPMYDLEAAKAAVDRVAQTFGWTDMPGALERARRVAEAASSLPTRNLCLLDDSTRHIWQTDSANTLADTGKALSKLYTGGITHFSLGKPDEYNPLVTDLSRNQRLLTMVDQFTPTFIAGARAYNVGSDAQLVWKVDDATVEGDETAPLHLDAAGVRKTLSKPNLTTGGPHVISATLEAGDRLQADNTRWSVANVASDLKMLVVDGEGTASTNGGSGQYLQAALSPEPQQADIIAKRPRLVTISTISGVELSTEPLDSYCCVALCGVGGITPDIANRLEKFVRDGGALWLFMGPQVTDANYNANLLPHHLLPGPLVERVTVTGDADGRRFDFDPAHQVHPLLRDFYQQERTGLESVRIYSYWQADLSKSDQVQHLLDYLPAAGNARKDPAMTLQSLGAGSVLFCSTTAYSSDEWTTFPKKKAFAEVMLSLFLGTVGTNDDWLNLTVGQALAPPQNIKFTAAPTLRDSANTDYAMIQRKSDDGSLAYASGPLERPGIYTLSTGSATYPVAVNVDPAEGDTRLVDSSVISQALGGIDIQFEQDQAPMAAVAGVDQGSDFGWPVLLLVLALVGAESLMAMKFGRARRLAA